jgi:hypothetical protein
VNQFRDAEPDKRMKDKAAQCCRALCRMRVLDTAVKETRTAERLKLVFQTKKRRRDAG